MAESGRLVCTARAHRRTHQLQGLACPRRHSRQRKLYTLGPVHAAQDVVGACGGTQRLEVPRVRRWRAQDGRADDHAIVVRVAQTRRPEPAVPDYHGYCIPVFALCYCERRKGRVCHGGEVTLKIAWVNGQRGDCSGDTRNALCVLLRSAVGYGHVESIHAALVELERLLLH